MVRKFIFVTVSWLVGIVLVQAQTAEPPRFTFDAGAGFTQPIGHLENRIDTGWNIQAGAGINLVPWLGVMGQFMYTESGLSGSFLQSVGEPDGNFRMWGFSLDPIVRFNPKGHFDFYLIGGPGVYRRTVEFTQPTIATVTAFDPFFGYFFPVNVPANQVIGSFGTTKFGMNGGGGFTVRLGNSNAKLFAEARYIKMYTRGTSTSILPVTFGIRY
ncbi:MAG TPA: outer membrane beta-barrel protein [Bryobacteraceae bacterium]|nr:outer membrane beta-barrel protein [Bryobacteraceae bacterium]